MTNFLSAAAPRATFERHLTDRESKTLLAHIAKFSGLFARRDHAWIRIALLTGFRLGTLRHFTVGDARSAIATGVARAAAEFAKGGRGYDVSIAKPCKQALQDALKIRKAMCRPFDDASPLFCSREGDAMAERTFEHCLQKWRKAAGLSTAASPHWLRHTFAKRVYGSTEHHDPQGVVQAMLGHASRASTVIYTLPDREHLRRAAEGAYL